MRKLFGGSVLFGLALWALPVTGGDKCVCPEMKASSVAWCGHCQSGMAFSHPIKSQKLIIAMEGAPVEVDKLKCPGCKTAAKAGGACCDKTYAHNKAYTSFVAGRIAKGEVVDAGKIECPACKKAASETVAFYCTGCNQGFVDGLVYHSQDDFDAAKKADEILVRAVAACAKCEECAVGMVTNGKCTHCKVTFKDGEVIKS